MGLIRPAKSVDAFALVSILQERHPETRYAVDVPIDEPIARKFLASCVQRHGGQTEGSTFIMVHEDAEGQPDAFVLGILARVYAIGTRLAASDVFLLGRKSANTRVLMRLLDRYIAWADANPRVYEIGVSWADSIPGNNGLIPALKRRGFSMHAQSFRRDRAAIVMEAAA